MLPEAAAMIGDPQVRNWGTIGGSLAHADPAADWPAVVLALGAELRATGPKGFEHGATSGQHVLTRRRACDGTLRPFATAPREIGGRGVRVSPARIRPAPRCATAARSGGRQRGSPPP